jgi:hypothetical protein
MQSEKEHAPMTLVRSLAILRAANLFIEYAGSSTWRCRLGYLASDPIQTLSEEELNQAVRELIMASTDLPRPYPELTLVQMYVLLRGLGFQVKPDIASIWKVVLDLPDRYWGDRGSTNHLISDAGFIIQKTEQVHQQLIARIAECESSPVVEPDTVLEHIAQFGSVTTEQLTKLMHVPAETMAHALQKPDVARLIQYDAQSESWQPSEAGLKQLWSDPRPDRAPESAPLWSAIRSVLLDHVLPTCASRGLTRVELLREGLTSQDTPGMGHSLLAVVSQHQYGPITWERNLMEQAVRDQQRYLTIPLESVSTMALEIYDDLFPSTMRQRTNRLNAHAQQHPTLPVLLVPEHSLVPLVIDHMHRHWNGRTWLLSVCDDLQDRYWKIDSFPTGHLAIDLVLALLPYREDAQ